MNSASPFSNLALRRRFKPNLAHFESLLELFTTPALLIDGDFERVIMANTPAVELTAFTRLELSGASLQMLIPSIDRNSFKDHSHAPIHGTLIKRNGTLLDTQINLLPLDDQKQWNLLLLEPAAAIAQRNAEIQRQSRLLEAIHKLILSFQESNPDAALIAALDAGRLLIGASLVAVYSAEEDDYTLKRSAVSGPAETLPSQISPNDLVALQTPYIWSRRKRAISALHREVRIANLSFAVTSPLGQPNALIGLIVAAGENEPDGDSVLTYIQILANAVTGIIQNKVLINYLQNSLNIKNKAIEFGRGVKEASQEGIIVLGPNLTIQELNPTAESILGYASREVEGRPYQHIMAGVDNIIPPFVSDQPASSIHNLGDVHLYRRDGRSFLANVRTLPLTVDNDLESILIMIQDLSQEEQYRLHNQQLEQRALIGEVSAILAHEFRNPLNNISTGLQLMEVNLQEGDPHKEVVSGMQEDVDRLEEMMKHTLAFVRPIEYNLEPLNLSSVMPKLLERWLPHLARVNIQHSFQIDPNTPPILGDVRALEQVWTNLIGNAIQAMSAEGGSLVVKVRPVPSLQPGQMIEVSITDTGPGIPDEIKERIFEPFFTTNRSGTGLGLPLSKRIVAAHRGTIKVITFPGGTSFQVQLPAAPES